MQNRTAGDARKRRAGGIARARPADPADPQHSPLHALRASGLARNLRRTLACAAALGALQAASAAEVTVVLETSGGVLRITGGDADDQLEIRAGATADAFTVTGRNGTTVNGTGSADVSGVRRIIVNTGGGADRLEILDATVRGDLVVLLGDGDDDAIFRNVTVRGRTSIRGEAGADRIVAESACNFRRALRIVTGTGDDIVTLRSSAFAGDVWIDTGASNDGVVLDRASFVRGADFDLRAGTGDDAIEIDECGFDGSVDVEMGRDDDRVTIDDSEFDRSADFSGDRGNDDRLVVENGNDFRRPPRFESFERER